MDKKIGILKCIWVRGRVDVLKSFLWYIKICNSNTLEKTMSLIMIEPTLSITTHRIMRTDLDYYTTPKIQALKHLNKKQNNPQV